MATDRGFLVLGWSSGRPPMADDDDITIPDAGLLREMGLTPAEFVEFVKARRRQAAEEERDLAEGRIQPRPPMHYEDDLPEPVVVRDEE
jgi:hypothetical protein